MIGSDARDDAGQRELHARSQKRRSDLSLPEATGLVIANWKQFGSTDVLPKEPEWAVLAAFAQEAVVAAWGEEPRYPTPSLELLALSELATRSITLHDPQAGLRFAAAVTAHAYWIEATRSKAEMSPACRAELRTARGTMVASAAYARRDHLLEELKRGFPLMFKSDVAACFGSIQPMNALVLPWFAGSLMGREFQRFGMTSLPVGGIQSRWLAEWVLSKAIDDPLRKSGFQYVRHMDDVWVGVSSRREAHDAQRIITFGLATRALTLNKAKTDLVLSHTVTPLAAPSLGELRELLKTDGDRVAIMCGLRQLRELGAGLPPRERERWTRILLSAIETLPGSSTPLLRTILALSAGHLDDDAVVTVVSLGESPFSVTRARAIELLSMYAVSQVGPVARTLAIQDPSPLVRRESLFAMARLEDLKGVRATLEHPCVTGAERSARLVVAGALGVKSNVPKKSSFENLLLRAARDYGQGPMLRPRKVWKER